MLAPVRTVLSSTPLVTLAEAKLHLGIINSVEQDALINSLVNAATSYLDGYSGILGRAMLTQTWRQDFAGFSKCMRLPVGNLIAVSSVQYYDSFNNLQTLSADAYSSLSDELGPFLVLNSGFSWPSTFDRRDAVRVTWTAGYGPAATDVPAAIKEAVLLLVGHFYGNREAVTVGTLASELPLGVAALISPYRRKSL